MIAAHNVIRPVGAPVARDPRGPTFEIVLLAIVVFATASTPSMPASKKLRMVLFSIVSPLSFVTMTPSSAPTAIRPPSYPPSIVFCAARLFEPPSRTIAPPSPVPWITVVFAKNAMAVLVTAQRIPSLTVQPITVTDVVVVSFTLPVTTQLATLTLLTLVRTMGPVA